MLLAELAELSPDQRCEPFLKYKEILGDLCEYCSDVAACGGIPCFTFHFKGVNLEGSELCEIKAAMKALWQNVAEMETHKRFHIYRCMDCATDLCFQLASRLEWTCAAKLGVQFQQVIGCFVEPPGRKMETDHDLERTGQ